LKEIERASSCGLALQQLIIVKFNRHTKVNRLLIWENHHKIRVAWESNRLNGEGDMGTFLLGVFIVLVPSLAAVAWLSWYSGVFESSDRERKEKPWIGS
jgi:hypothetical protein